MTYLLWIVGLALLGGVGFGAYRAIQNPVFFAGLAKVIFNALVPVILKRKTPEEEKEDNEAYLENRVMPTRQHPHGDEGGHR